MLRILHVAFLVQAASFANLGTISTSSDVYAVGVEHSLSLHLGYAIGNRKQAKTANVAFALHHIWDLERFGMRHWTRAKVLLEARQRFGFRVLFN